jgi:diguanylate cyclase (GGDEF)-like protein
MSKVDPDCDHGFPRAVVGRRNRESSEALAAENAGAIRWMIFCGIFSVSIIATVSLTLAQRGQPTRLLVGAAVVCALVVAFIAPSLVRLWLKRRWSNRRLAVERRELSVAVNNIPQGLVLYDNSSRVTVCNQRYIEMFGLSPDVAKPGCTMYELISHRKETGSFSGDVGEFCASIRRNVALGKITHQIVDTADGRAIQIINQPLEAGGWVATIEDVTERKRSDEKIVRLAHYDALTDLPNRVLFREQLESALKKVQPDQQLAVLYIDIDEFKSVNDALGHSVGDELLKAVAGRLRGCLGASDVAARLGGDEFAIIQTAIGHPSDTTHLVGRIYEAIRKPYDCGGHLITTDASIGIALAPQQEADLDQLLKNADMAMYEAKADGRRTYRFFELSMDARVKTRRILELELRQAIIDGGFEVYYQPLVNLGDNTISSCEALLRWRHPKRGMISPAEFIPIAEETGLINQLGDWVLNTACAEAASWPVHIRVAVNVSPIQFRSETLALNVATALATSGLAPCRLELEITEAILIRDDEVALALLHQLRELGVRIALDDFGTGYSSLSYLQRFPFDKIKIDRCFVKDIAGPAGSSSIVQAIVNIAAASNMTTTAEGVETVPQMELLRELGCTEMQGYLFSPAISCTEMRRMLHARREEAVSAA